MKYFMIIWQAKEDNHNFLGSSSLRDRLQNIAGKVSDTKSEDPTEKYVVEIGEDCEFMKSSLPNVVFYRTDNHDITEEAITVWLKQALNEELFSRRYVYIKEVSSPYHVPLDWQ